MVNYKNYVKKGLWNDFVKMCHNNSLEFYGCSCVLTAHLVMQDLMQHTYKGIWKEPECTPKEAWKSAFKQFGGHSGMSAAMTATIIAKYSPRGKEFVDWCKKDEVVMVNWKAK